MARGTESKAKIFNQLLSKFEGAFSPDGKEIRIPIMENGEEVQIKVALTCAKDNISHAGTASTPAEAPAFPTPVNKPQENIAPSAEEKARVASLAEQLGLF